MQLAGEGASPPTVRVYQWIRPTISLGYFQHFADFEKLPPPARELPVVRRITGGGAILHDLELTYSIAVPVGHALVVGGAGRLYETAHQAVIHTLQELGATASLSGCSDDSGAARGPFFCFARRHCLDVIVGLEKIAGSAQRRTRTAVLQHGSIVLANRYSQQPTASVAKPFLEAIDIAQSRFPAHFVKIANVDCTPSGWSSEELAKTEELLAKYTAAEWTRRT